VIDVIYKSSLSLLTDLYQLTMGYGYFKKGMAEKEAVFHLFFRKNPFKGNYTISSGLHDVIAYLKQFQFREDDIAYLRTLKGADDKELFSEDYLHYLNELRFSCDIHAVPEGRVVFPHEPLIRIKGPLLQAQLLETALLNIVNFQSLIATKASRICYAAQGEPVLEFGMRRSQGIDGALSASRSAYIGGAVSTSNVLAGKIYGIPLKGTHAHSWIMSFPTEPEAFDAFSETMPNNCVFLVDTYDTIQGIKNAIEVGKKLLSKGHRILGIRLDSGDLANLSITGRKLLDEAGFTDASIVASNDLDEYTIEELKSQGAKIDVWGVGTRLVTAYDQPALGGVYKVSAVQEKDSWAYKIKFSEDAIKISNPGVLQVRRYFDQTNLKGDVIYNVEDHENQTHFSGMAMDGKTQKSVANNLKYEELLVPVFSQGKCVYKEPSIQESRECAQRDLKLLLKVHQELRQSQTPYEVFLESKLFELKKSLMEKN
jgi:nicotinate phosphoribosyltransferase